MQSIFTPKVFVFRFWANGIKFCIVGGIVSDPKKIKTDP